jgi:hypothetical protein
MICDHPTIDVPVAQGIVGMPSKSSGLIDQGDQIERERTNQTKLLRESF